MTWNIASIDGCLALPQLFALGGDVDIDIRRLHEPEAMMTGADSMWPLEEFPRPPAARTVGGDGRALYDDAATSLSSSAPAFMVVTDSRGRLPEEAFANLRPPGGQYAGLQLVMLVARATPSSYLAYLRESDVPYLLVGDERIDLVLALDRLGELGVRTLVADAGGHLHGALLSTGLVDEVDVLLVPGLVSGRGPSLFDGAPLTMTESVSRLTPIAIEPREDGSVFLRYQVGETVQPRPWRPD